MVATPGHEKRILLIEDNSTHYRTIMRRLREEGYTVDRVQTYDDAIHTLMTRHYHVAIVDLFLVNPPVGEPDGVRILHAISESPLARVLTAIILTSYPSTSSAVEAVNLGLEGLNVTAYISKLERRYVDRLLTTLGVIFKQKLKIRFNLDYELGCGKRIPQIAQDILEGEADKLTVDPEVLKQEIQDLLGKVFYTADRLYIDSLKPGLTGAAVIQARPTRGGNVEQTYVVKLGRRDKITTEYRRFKKYMSGLLAGGTVTAVNCAITRDLGAICYTFAENDHGQALYEFDSFYSDPTIKVEWVMRSLRHLFDQTYSKLHDQPKRKHSSLPELYYKAFQLTPERLIERIQEQIPDFSLANDYITLPTTGVQLVNPLAWIEKYSSICTMPVYHAITHGDLTGRNLMVDPVRSEGPKPNMSYYKFWLIDFYRTYKSHILRDIVILETDIKYRLMTTPTDEEFIVLESILAGTIELAASLPPHLFRAASTILTLRDIGKGMLRANNDDVKNKEYKLSLLMATLNAVRLKHISPERKQQALVSASLICEQLSFLIR